MHRSNTAPAFRPDRHGPPVTARLPNVAYPRVAAPIRWCFLLFLFSIAFEYVEFLRYQNLFTLAKFLGIAMGGIALLQPMVCFARPPKAFWLLVVYYAIFAFMIIAQPTIVPTARSMLMTLGQCLLLFWISYNCFRFGGMWRPVFITIAFSNTIVAALMLGGFGTIMEDRESIFGQNLNSQAFMFSLGIVCAVALATDKRFSLSWRLTSIPMIALMAFGIMRTGSRGGMLSCLAGIMVFVLFSKGFKGKVKSVLAGGIVLAVLFYLVLHSENFMARWRRTFDEGKVAGRDKIFTLAFDMFLEKPILGWGAGANRVELARRLNAVSDERDTHNDILFVLTATGGLGGAFFFSGVGLCVWAAWKSRDGPAGVFPLALVMVVLAITMSGTMQRDKNVWIILGMGAASGAVVVDQKKMKKVQMLARASRRGAPSE